MTNFIYFSVSNYPVCLSLGGNATQFNELHYPPKINTLSKKRNERFLINPFYLRFLKTDGIVSVGSNGIPYYKQYRKNNRKVLIKKFFIRCDVKSVSP